MENIEVITPLYWLKWAKNSFENSIENLEKGAEKLEKLVGSFWIVYTTLYGVGGVFVVNFTEYNVPLPAICLLALPVFLLMLSYWSCYRAQMPVDAYIDPVRPNIIYDGYVKIFNKKKIRLKWALNWTLLSALFLASGLFSWLFIKNQSEKPITKTEFLSCLNYKQDTLFISGILPADTLISIKIEVSDSVKKKIPVYVNYKKTNLEEIFNQKFALDSIKTDFVFVTVGKHIDTLEVRNTNKK